MQISVLRFAAIAVVLAALSPCTHGQGLGRPMDADRRILLTKKEALAFLPAEVVCEPMVGQRHTGTLEGILVRRGMDLTIKYKDRLFYIVHPVILLL